MIEAFQNIRFKQATLAQIDKANEIIDEYQALGFVLTLRQLFYQFVSRNALANTFREDTGSWGAPSPTGAAPVRSIGRRSRTAPATSTTCQPGTVRLERIRTSASVYFEDIWASSWPISARDVDREGRADRRDRRRVAEDSARLEFSCRGNVSDSESCTPPATTFRQDS